MANRKRRASIINAVAILIVGLCLIGGILFVRLYEYQDLSTKNQVLPRPVYSGYIPRKDKEVLLNPDSTPEQIVHALRELARLQRDPLAKEKAMDRLTDPSPLFRSAAATALGWFKDDKSLASLESLLNDPVLSVRISTLKALGQVKSSRREILLVQIQDKEGLDDTEKIAALLSLFQVTHSNKVKAEVMRNLVSLAVDGKKSIQTLAALKAFQLQPKNKNVLKMLKTKIIENKDSSLVSLGIRHLSALESQWCANKKMSGPWVIGFHMVDSTCYGDHFSDICM